MSLFFTPLLPNRILGTNAGTNGKIPRLFSSELMTQTKNVYDSIPSCVMHQERAYRNGTVYFLMAAGEMNIKRHLWPHRNGKNENRAQTNRTTTTKNTQTNYIPLNINQGPAPVTKRRARM